MPDPHINCQQQQCVYFYSYRWTIIDSKQLQRLVPYALVHIKRLEEAGEFPKRVSLGANRVGWLLYEVIQWIKNKVAERDGELEEWADLAANAEQAFCKIVHDAEIASLVKNISK